MLKLDASQLQELVAIRKRFANAQNDSINNILKQMDYEEQRLDISINLSQIVEGESKKELDNEIVALENSQAVLFGQLKNAIQQLDAENEATTEAVSESKLSEPEAELDTILSSGLGSDEGLDELYDELVSDLPPPTLPEAELSAAQGDNLSAIPIDAATIQSSEKSDVVQQSNFLPRGAALKQRSEELMAQIEADINNMSSNVKSLDNAQTEQNKVSHKAADAPETKLQSIEQTIVGFAQQGMGIAAKFINKVSHVEANENKEFTKQLVGLYKNKSQEPESKFESAKMTVEGVARQGINIAARFINKVRNDEVNDNNDNPALTNIKKNDRATEKQEFKALQNELNETLKEMNKFIKIIKGKPSATVVKQAEEGFKACEDKLEKLSKKIEDIINHQATTKEGRNALLDLTSTIKKQEDKLSEAFTKAQNAYQKQARPNSH